MAVWDSAEQRMWSRHSHPWLAELLFALDARLRRRQAVFEYSRDARCVFRLDIGRSPRALALRDGTRVHPGQRIARLHFWNEQVPPLPASGATIAWARRMQQAIAISLVELARFLASRPDLRDIAAVCGDVPSGTRAQSQQLARIMARYGFETVAEAKPLPIGERVYRFGENILISLIVYRRFHFRTPKVAAIVSEMVRSPQMMMRRLREGAEFFAFLRERRELAH